MSRCTACGRLPSEPCCERCHRAAEIATYEFGGRSDGVIPSGQHLDNGYSIVKDPTAHSLSKRVVVRPGGP